MGWAWVSGEDNPADWCTKSRLVREIVPGGFWEKGPEFLKTDENSWPIKLSYKTDQLEGELQVRKRSHCAHIVQVDPPHVFDRLVNRLSCWKKMIRVLAWILRISKPVTSSTLGCEEIRRAKYLLIKYAQNGMEVERRESEEMGIARYRKLAPMQDDDSVWRVGSRLRNFVPFTMDTKLPVIIPYNHKITL